MHAATSHIDSIRSAGCSAGRRRWPGWLVVGCVACLAWPAGAEEPASVRADRPVRPRQRSAERARIARELRAAYARPPATWPAPEIDPGVAWQELGLLPPVVHPETNPFSTAKADLGATLFFDTRLSASHQMACVTCHEPNLGWADGREVSQPHGPGPLRNTPSIRNAAFAPSLFWDGRATSLEDQARAAFTNPVEMAADPEAVVRLLTQSPGYRRLFATAFPDQPISFDRVVDAVACFERTVVGGRSRFDTFLRGDTAVLSDAEILGLDLFRREARCLNCHHGPTLSDGRFHDLGLSYYSRSKEDLGRHAVSQAAADVGRFRTPSLRDVTQTGPLMHNGLFELDGVLNMYNAGMVTLKRQAYQRDDPLFPVKSPHLRPLRLNEQDLADLAAFLGTLAEPRRRFASPTQPEIGDSGVNAER
jgi:cytochrome c peroxidase